MNNYLERFDKRYREKIEKLVDLYEKLNKLREKNGTRVWISNEERRERLVRDYGGTYEIFHHDMRMVRIDENIQLVERKIERESK